MTGFVELLSDTVYRDKAAEIIDHFVDEHDLPVTRSQIHGLRQIAIQQPLAIKSFANHQKERAEKKNTSGTNHKLASEAEFWKLVGDLCEPKKLSWSPASEADQHLPTNLRGENIPEKRKGMSPEDRGQRNRLVKQQREWLEDWNRLHVPAFFRRFCTHYLYRLGLHEPARSTK